MTVTAVMITGELKRRLKVMRMRDARARTVQRKRLRMKNPVKAVTAAMITEQRIQQMEKIHINFTHMGFIARLIKWKSRFVVISGFFTVIVIPLARWIINERKNAATTKAEKDVVDADFAEVKPEEEKRA
jgi:hypothetical protein